MFKGVLVLLLLIIYSSHQHIPTFIQLYTSFTSIIYLSYSYSIISQQMCINYSHLCGKKIFKLFIIQIRIPMYASEDEAYHLTKYIHK